MKLLLIRMGIDRLRLASGCRRHKAERPQLRSSDRLRAASWASFHAERLGRSSKEDVTRSPSISERLNPMVSATIIGYCVELCKMPKAAAPTGNVVSPSAGWELPLRKSVWGTDWRILRIGFRPPRPGQDCHCGCRGSASMPFRPPVNRRLLRPLRTSHFGDQAHRVGGSRAPAAVSISATGATSG